ncbi:MAG: radical SAM protein [Desulfobacterales bacterium]|nr:radical SAM protein [Desulfobacterales bacterium]
MESYRLENIHVIPEKKGFQEFSKVSYPIRYGRFSEIQTPDYTFQFNLNGEIKFIQGRGQNWPHPGEWLKRTIGNDWLYYSAGSYNGIIDIIGEYYYPCLPYPSNSLFNGYGIDTAIKNDAIHAWASLQSNLSMRVSASRSNNLNECLARIAQNDIGTLQHRSNQYPDLINGHITVLPPDSRHVDYETIPVIIADGCLYHCGFCRVKSAGGFMPRSRADILEQIEQLKKFYGRDIYNYNSVFLGQHDTLMTETALIEFTALKAHQLFEFEHSNLKNPSLFLFGSVDSLLGSDESKFSALNRLPFKTYLNLGLESVDPETLDVLKKPITSEKVKDAFIRTIELNKKYERVEISVNFVLGEGLAIGHLPSLLDLVRNSLDRFYSKGAVYLSPLIGSNNKKELLRQFYRVKTMSRFPVYIYLIQRL